jgi:hypothetical protein
MKAFTAITSTSEATAKTNKTKPKERKVDDARRLSQAIPASDRKNAASP